MARGKGVNICAWTGQGVGGRPLRPSLLQQYYYTMGEAAFNQLDDKAVFRSYQLIPMGRIEATVSTDPGQLAQVTSSA